MRSERHRQRDLFEQRPILPDLRSDLRSKLTPLLQELLTEAAGDALLPAMTTRDGEGKGDEQDQA